MQVLLLNDNTEHPNWGAQATPYALRRILEQSLPACEIQALTWSWIRTYYRTPRLPGMKAVQIPRDVIPFGQVVFNKLTRPMVTFPEVRDDFDWFADQWVAGRMGRAAQRFVELARWADVVVYNGENNLYRNTLEGCRSIFLMYLVKSRLGKPACAVNHTVHITGVRPIMKAMIESVFPMLDLVTSREPCSHRALQELGVTAARSGADVVFALSETDEARQKVDRWLEEQGLAGRPYACLSASGLPVSRPRGDHEGAMTGLARRLGEELGMPVVLLARDPSCQFMQEVARRTGFPYFGSEHHFTELWPLFRKATMVVTGHYHYVIIAAISGCPFVPLSANNHKMQGVCEQLGWARTEPFDATWLGPVIGDICTEAAGCAARREALGQRLAARSAELGALARKTGDWVREVATGSGAGLEGGA